MTSMCHRTGPITAGKCFNNGIATVLLVLVKLIGLFFANFFSKLKCVNIKKYFVLSDDRYHDAFV